MSNTTKAIINRQWYIIDVLTKTDCYLSTKDIRQYLDDKGISVEIRTIQRDLNDLKEIFPLECRTDDKPYGWRWARVQYSKKQKLTFIQALAFRLIETQLQEHLSSELMDGLEPLFLKARFMLLDHDFGSQSNEILLRELIDCLPRSKSDQFHQKYDWHDRHAEWYLKIESDKKSIFATFMDKIHKHKEYRHETKLIEQLKNELEQLDLQVLATAI